MNEENNIYGIIYKVTNKTKNENVTYWKTTL